MSVFVKKKNILNNNKMPGLPHFNYYFHNETQNQFSQIEGFDNNDEHVFAMFYAPWCPHCKTAEPEFNKVSNGIAVDYEDYVSGNYKKHKDKIVLVKINGEDRKSVV